MPARVIAFPPPPPLTHDILLRILEHVYYVDPCLDRTPDYKALRSASLVCAGWAPPAQALLYRYKTERARTLRETVRKLEVSFKDPLRNKKLKITNAEFMYIVQGCPFLYEVVVSENPEAIGPDIADGLRAGAPVRALRLQLVTDMDRLLELVQIWPTIQFLDVLPPKPLPEPVDAMFAADEFRLRELRLNVCYDPTGTLATHIAPALARLETLSINRGTLKRDAFATLIAHVRGTLRSLTVECWDDATAGVVASCGKLEELILWTNVFRCSIPLLDTLPPTLVHLGFYLHGSQDGSRLEREREVIGGISNKLPNLRVVTSYNYLGVREREWATPFVRYCRAKGIRIREFPTGGGEAPVDSVPVDQFPRLLSSVNFQLMAPLPQIVQRQRLIDYTAPPPISNHKSSSSFSGSRKGIKSFSKRLFSGSASGSRDEAATGKYEKLD
ncbi:hypothetical protein BKA62DRAFT_703557 [Auriculariales sp. MPI-PUGE-AT-0066]|nr:hypothetical protein BKA62DRAFT_703557 [Auriculariales sp. MPI-PUGE-AT-0066]